MLRRLALALALALASPAAGAPPAPAPDRGPIASRRITFPPAFPMRLAMPGGRTGAARSMLRVTTRLRYGEFVWNEAGVAGGRPWVRIDLERQLLSVFRGGDEIGSAVILYGADAKPTPRGRFVVLAKLRDHRSSLYDAPMPFTIRLTGDGVAIHGSNVRERAATHGCIGVPTAFARLLFGAIATGDSVAIV